MNIQFLRPELLWFLLILLVPIIIHLFNFRKYQKIYFSNILFLEKLESENKRKSNLKKILQLISRLLCFIFLVLTFSQPIITDTDKLVLEEKLNTEYTIYIDNSFSMNIESVQGINIEAGKQKAIDLINSTVNNIKFNILSNNLENKNLHLDKEQAIKIIQEINTNAKASKLSDIIKKAKQINKYNNGIDEKLIIISDFQKNTSDIDKFELDSTQKIVLIPLITKNTSNLYIDTCYFKNIEHRYQEIDTLELRIKNTSLEDFFNVPINLFINDSLKLAHSFSIKSESETIIKLKYKNTVKGIIKARLSINDYPIVYDNNLYFNYNINSNKNVLVINSGRENKYIKALYTTENNFTLRNTSTQKINDSHKYQLIILNRINDIESDFANKLSNYIRQGGNLLLIPGDNVSEKLNIFLRSINSPYYGKIKNNTQRISYIEQNSDIYKKTFKNLKKDALMPEVYKYYILKEDKDVLSENIWLSENNNIIMSHSKFYSGNSYVMACALNNKWTNITTHKLFVPALWNIAHSKTKNHNLYYTISKHDKVFIDNKNSKEKIIHITNKKNKIDIIAEYKISKHQESYLNLHNQIRKASNYNLVSDGENFAACSFNYSREESDLKFHSLSDIKKLSSENISIISDTDTNTNWKEELINQDNGNELWRYLLILCLLFLMLEFYLKNKI